MFDPHNDQKLVFGVFRFDPHNDQVFGVCLIPTMTKNWCLVCEFSPHNDQKRVFGVFRFDPHNDQKLVFGVCVWSPQWPETVF